MTHLTYTSEFSYLVEMQQFLGTYFRGKRKRIARTIRAVPFVKNMQKASLKRRYNVDCLGVETFD